MISEQEARNAADRKKGHPSGGSQLVQYMDDLKTLVDYAVQELARRDWQDEPSGEGWYWCEEDGEWIGPRNVRKGHDGKWQFQLYSRWLPLTGRVCKITERPG